MLVLMLVVVVRGGVNAGGGWFVLVLMLVVVVRVGVNGSDGGG